MSAAKIDVTDGSAIDIFAIGQRMRTSEFNHRNHSLMIRLRKPSAHVLLYKNGRAVMTGSVSPNAAFLSWRKLVHILRKLSIQVISLTVNVHNIVLTGTIKRLHRSLFDEFANSQQFKDFVVRFDPEQHTAIHFVHTSLGVGGMIYPSGKFIINKCRCELLAARTADELSRCLNY